MVSLNKWYSLKTSTHRDLNALNADQSLLLSPAKDRQSQLLNKLEIIENKLGQTMQWNKENYSENSKKIEQCRFSYVLKTIQSNLESLLEKIQKCHPSYRKNNYSYLKFSQPTVYSRTLDGSLMERSSAIWSPSIVTDEGSIESIFKLLSRTDKALESLSETLNKEACFRNQLSKKINFGVADFEWKSEEVLKLAYETKFEKLKIDLQAEYSQKIKEMVQKHTQQMAELKKQHGLDIQLVIEGSDRRFAKTGNFYKDLWNQNDYSRDQSDNAIDNLGQSWNNQYSHTNLQTFRNCDNLYENRQFNKSQENSSKTSFDEELEKSKQMIQQEENEKYKKFIEDFTDFRKQEIDLFRSNQILFVKNLQKEVENLTGLVKTVIKRSTGSQRASENEELASIQDSIELVSNNIKNYFTKVTDKSIENDSYLSVYSKEGNLERRKCKSQISNNFVKVKEHKFY
jgi:hypothetical protein